MTGPTTFRKPGDDSRLAGLPEFDCSFGVRGFAFDQRHLIAGVIVNDLIHEGSHQEDTSPVRQRHTLVVGRIRQSIDVETRSLVADDERRFRTGKSGGHVHSTFREMRFLQIGRDRIFERTIVQIF